MQEITVFDINGNSITNLVQWDKDVKIHVTEDEIDDAYNVHFFNQNNIDVAMVVESTYQENTLSATVPNDLLSEPYPITGYIYIEKNNEHKSVYCFRIIVRKRPKPASYIYSDQEEYITFKQVLDEAKEFAKSANDYSVLSRSYAIGDTGLRENEELDSAKGYYEQAKVSAINAKKSENNAQASQDATSKSEENAASSANEAEMFHLQAKSYAVGTEGEVRPTDIFDNAKSYSELAQQLVDESQKLLEQAQRIVAAATAGAIIPDGTITFEELPTEPKIGYMYNISNDFTTDERFVDGSGIFYRAGTNVYWTKEEKWDIMVGIQVTGVKGSAESSYRVGNVDITKANIGLGNVENKSSSMIRGELVKADITKALGYTPPTSNTWRANTASNEGYVAKGSGHANSYWGTDANGNPSWKGFPTVPDINMFENLYYTMQSLLELKTIEITGNYGHKVRIYRRLYTVLYLVVTGSNGTIPTGVGEYILITSGKMPSWARPATSVYLIPKAPTHTRNDFRLNINSQGMVSIYQYVANGQSLTNWMEAFTYLALN